MRIHFLSNYSAKVKTSLREHFPKSTISFAEENLDFSTIEIVVGGRPSAELIAKCLNLKKMIIPYAGLPATTKALMQKYPEIAVHNLHHNSLSVAENAITFLFSMAKDIMESHNKLKLGNWESRYKPNRSSFISGKNILLLGFGSIGKDIFRLLSGFQMNFFVYNRSSALSENVTKIGSKSEMNKLLPQIDFIINSLPLTDMTRDFLDEPEFSNMSPQTCLVNVGRANTIAEEALFNALENKRIKAAYFDVWYNYPTTVESRKNTTPTNLPFHKLDNFYYSPHRAGGLGIEELEEMRLRKIIEYLELYAQKLPLPHQVDLVRGY